MTGPWPLFTRKWRLRCRVGACVSHHLPPRRCFSIATKLSSNRGGTGWMETPATPGKSPAGSGGVSPAMTSRTRSPWISASTTDAAPASFSCTTRLRSPGAVNQVGPATRLLAKLRRRAVAQHLALVHQNHLVAALGFVQVGGAEQHGHAFLLHQAINDLPEFAPRHGVHTDRRLVQQQQFAAAAPACRRGPASVSCRRTTARPAAP